METWKTIPNSDEKYEISDFGRVRNKKSNRILKPSWSRGGYEKVIIYTNERHYNAKVHRLVAESFVDKIEGNDAVNHLDGNKHNNKATNLEWCTTKDNNQHAFKNGLNYRPDSSGVPKRKIELIETKQIFESVSDCARYINANTSGIFACLSGRRKTCKGYTFRYVD